LGFWTTYRGQQGKKKGQLGKFLRGWEKSGKLQTLVKTLLTEKIEGKKRRERTSTIRTTGGQKNKEKNGTNCAQGLYISVTIQVCFGQTETWALSVKKRKGKSLKTGKANYCKK